MEKVYYTSHSGSGQRDALLGLNRQGPTLADGTFGTGVVGFFPEHVMTLYCCHVMAVIFYTNGILGLQPELAWIERKSCIECSRHEIRRVFLMHWHEIELKSMVEEDKTRVGQYRTL